MFDESALKTGKIEERIEGNFLPPFPQVSERNASPRKRVAAMVEGKKGRKGTPTGNPSGNGGRKGRKFPDDSNHDS